MRRNKVQYTKFEIIFVYFPRKSRNLEILVHKLICLDENGKQIRFKVVKINKFPSITQISSTMRLISQ